MSRAATQNQAKSQSAKGSLLKKFNLTFLSPLEEQGMATIERVFTQKTEGAPPTPVSERFGDIADEASMGRISSGFSSLQADMASAEALGPMQESNATDAEPTPLRESDAEQGEERGEAGHVGAGDLGTLGGVRAELAWAETAMEEEEEDKGRIC